MTNNKDELIELLLATEWKLLNASVETLRRSAEKCKLIGIKQEYSFEEQESFDSLSSKFNRTSDLFTQKVIRTTWMLLHESFAPFIDMMQMGEKIGLLHSANEMIGIRDMRNQIAHEYIPDALRDLVPEIIDMTGQLVENIDCCSNFLKHRKWLIDGQ
jgi:hypothetical protein